MVDEATVLKALDFQRQHTLTIGQLALRQQKLTVRQVLTILNTQIVSPKLFGEIGVELGYLTANDLSDLFDLQSEPGLTNFIRWSRTVLPHTDIGLPSLSK